MSEWFECVIFEFSYGFELFPEIKFQQITRFKLRMEVKHLETITKWIWQLKSKRMRIVYVFVTFDVRISEWLFVVLRFISVDSCECASSIRTTLDLACNCAVLFECKCLQTTWKYIYTFGLIYFSQRQGLWPTKCQFCQRWNHHLLYLSHSIFGLEMFKNLMRKTCNSC